MRSEENSAWKMKKWTGRVPLEEKDENVILQVCLSKGNSLRSILQVEVSRWRAEEITEPLGYTTTKGLL